MTAPREILVLRHGKSSWDHLDLEDFDRPLARRGRRDAPRMGRWLAEHDLPPDRILSSPAKRARQTARRVARAMGFDRDRIGYDERIYTAWVGDLLDALSEMPADARRVMLVGHNPGFHELVEHLIGGPIDAPAGVKAFPTCALARIGVPGDWSALDEGCGELLALVRPRELAEE